MIRPDFKEFSRLARQATLVPVVKSISADLLTPVSAFLAIAEDEPDDPTRSVPNPARKALDKELRLARVSFTKLRERFGAMAIEYVDGVTPQADLQKMEKNLRSDMEKATARIQKLEARRGSLPTHLPLAQARKGQEVLKLSTERKHLTNILKMVAFQIESDLVEMIRPHYKRVLDEGRTLVQTILQDAADIEPREGQLRITLAPLSSPHRPRVVESLCETLNKTNTMFPGTQLRICYAVASLGS